MIASHVLYNDAHVRPEILEILLSKHMLIGYHIERFLQFPGPRE